MRDALLSTLGGHNNSLHLYHIFSVLVLPEGDLLLKCPSIEFKMRDGKVAELEMF